LPLVLADRQRLPPGTGGQAGQISQHSDGTIVATATCYRRQEELVRKMRLIAALLFGLIVSTSAWADVRIKDIADVEGIRDIN
jgi:hypothetical protein